MRQILLFIFSMVICLYAVESFLFLKGYYNDYQANMREAQKEGKPYDNRSLSQVILDLRSSGKHAFSSFIPQQFVYDADQYPQLLGGINISGQKIIPLGGISRAIIVACNEDGTWQSYPSDEYGFNNPSGLYNQGLDIVALGDSYVEGYCVGPDENSIAYLRRSGKQALALGKAGDGPLAMLATLREFAQEFKPKVVLWYYFEEDALDFLSKERNTVLRNYLDTSYSQHLKRMQPAIDQELSAFTDQELQKEREMPFHEKRSLGNYLSVFYKNILFLKDVRSLVEPQADPVSTQLSLLEDVLKEAKAETEAGGGHLYVVYLPAYARFEKEMGPQEQDSLFGRTKVLTVFKSLDIPVIDIVPYFKQSPDPGNYFIFHRHNHYTPEGYALIAQAVLKGISN